MESAPLTCPHCLVSTRHDRPTPIHIIHALLSLATLGLWLPVWFGVQYHAGGQPWTCTRCGTARMWNKRAPAHPPDRSEVVA
jgi:hypothetical protein